MSEPIAVFESFYGTRTMKCYNAYDGTFLDVFIDSTHPTNEGSQHFRMNHTDEEMLLTVLQERYADRVLRRARNAEHIEALEMNAEYNAIIERLNRCVDRYKSFGRIQDELTSKKYASRQAYNENARDLQMKFGKNTSDWDIAD